MTTCNLTFILTTELCCINERTDHFTPNFELFGVWLAVPCHQKALTLAPKPKSYWLARFHHWMKKTKYIWLFTCEFSIAIAIKKILFVPILPNIHVSFKGPLEDSKHEFRIWNRVNVSAQSECSWELLSIFFTAVWKPMRCYHPHSFLCLPVVSAMNDLECFLTLCAFQRSFIPFPSIIL